MAKPTKNGTTIVLADDHAIVRQGVRILLSAESGFEIIGEAGDGLEAVRLVDRLDPDILIVDLGMTGLNGLEVTLQVKKRHPKVGVIVLSMQADETYVERALKNGADGYVVKDANSADLVKAVREVRLGRRFLSPPFDLRKFTERMERKPADKLSPYDTLTSREREVLQLVAEGHTNAEIGGRLFISERTVEVHRSKLMHKLSLQSQSDLFHFAIRQGLLKA
jgi:two-component system response regulator NreC